MHKQLEEHQQHAIHGITERLDQLTDVIRFLVENGQSRSIEDDEFRDSRVNGQKDRNFTPR